MNYDEPPELIEGDYGAWLREQEIARAAAIVHPDTDHCPECGETVTWVGIGEHLNVECSGKKCTWWTAESLKRMGTESIPALVEQVRGIANLDAEITRLKADWKEAVEDRQKQLADSWRRRDLLRRVLDWANGGMKNWAEIMPDIEKELDP